MENSNFGELFWTGIYNQFLSVRDGDALWYENGQFEEEELYEIYGTSISDIIVRNTEIKNIADNIFFIRDRQLNTNRK